MSRHEPKRAGPNTTDSLMSKGTELFGSPMPGLSPYWDQSATTPSTGATLVATPDAAYMGTGTRKGFGVDEGKGRAGMGTYRSPFIRQNSDQSPGVGARGDVGAGLKLERPYSATTTVDGRGSVVVITYEEGLAEMGRHGFVSPARLATAKVEAAIQKSDHAKYEHASPQSAVPSARPTIETYNQPSASRAQPSVPLSPTFSPPSSRHTSAAPFTAPLQTKHHSPQPPLRPFRPSVSRKARAPQEEPASANTFAAGSAPARITDSGSPMKSGRSDDSTRREAKGRDKVEAGHGAMDLERDDRTEDRMTLKSPTSAFLPSYYQPAGDRRKTRTRGGQI